LASLIAAFVSVMLGLLIRDRWAKAKETKSKLIGLIIEGLDNILSDTFDYWSEKPNRRTATKLNMLGARLKSRLQSLGGEVERLLKKYHEADHSHCMDLMAHLTDAATGGSFETADRQADPGRYTNTRKVADKLRAKLLGYQ